MKYLNLYALLLYQLLINMIDMIVMPYSSFDESGYNLSGESH